MRGAARGGGRSSWRWGAGRRGATSRAGAPGAPARPAAHVRGGGGTIEEAGYVRGVRKTARAWRSRTGRGSASAASATLSVGGDRRARRAAARAGRARALRSGASPERRLDGRGGAVLGRGDGHRVRRALVGRPTRLPRSACARGRSGSSGPLLTERATLRPGQSLIARLAAHELRIEDEGARDTPRNCARAAARRPLSQPSRPLSRGEGTGDGRAQHRWRPRNPSPRRRRGAQGVTGAGAGQKADQSPAGLVRACRRDGENVGSRRLGGADGGRRHEGHLVRGGGARRGRRSGPGGRPRPGRAGGRRAV